MAKYATVEATARVSLGGERRALTGKARTVDVPRELEDGLVLRDALRERERARVRGIVALLVVGEDAGRDLLVVAREEQQEAVDGGSHHLEQRERLGVGSSTWMIKDDERTLSLLLAITSGHSRP